MLINLDSLWTLLALSIAAAAAFVALDFAKRLQTTGRREAWLWLVGAAVSMGTGVWSAEWVAGGAHSMASLGRWPAGLALDTWALAVGVSLVALAWAGRGVIGGARVAIGAAAWGAGVPAVAFAALASMGWQPGSAAAWAPLVWAPVAAGVVGAAGLGMFFLVGPTLKQHSMSCHVAAAAGLGASVAVSQHLVLGAMKRTGAPDVADTTLLPLEMVTGFIALATLAFLALLQLVSVREARKREAHHSARNDRRKHALRDPLTGLTNRVVFEGALSQAVQQADTNRTRLALLYIDLDGFSPINVALGHHNGDRILREVAARLKGMTGRSDRLARLGADEFLILRTNDPGTDAAAHLAGEVLECLSQPFRLADREASLTASIGIAMYPEHGAMSTVIAHADAAMRVAKGNGGATYSFFEARMLNGSREQMGLLRDLRVALAQGQLEMYYQPKIHAPSGEITGVEALMRWHHPKRGMVSPTVFIPIAERYGLIHLLGNWVIDEACRQAREWRDGGLRMRVAINLSAHQLRQGDLADRIAAALERHQIQAKLLTCEITESVAMEDSPSTVKFFEELVRVGVHISIDDFGTGYSSLAMLRKLPAEELKIDRSFVLDLETSSDARAVAEAVVQLAKALSLKVVAEGVETEAQNHILRGLGCDELQGYLFAKPMSGKAMALWAMNDVGPRSLAFRASLFKDTAPIIVH